MLRKSLVILCVLALTAPAWAILDMPTNNMPITVQLTIGTYTQIWFQDDTWATPPAANDFDIVFTNSATGAWPDDPWRSTASGLIGAYSWPAPNPPTSGLGTGYYESVDGATIWMQSNTAFTATITCSGDLIETGGSTIPTWFTIVVSEAVAGSGGFRDGACVDAATWPWVNDGVIPLSGGKSGGYGGDDPLGTGNFGNAVVVAGPIFFGGQGWFGTQDAFAMAGGPVYTLAMGPGVGPGTMKFLARCLRNGLWDVTGVYTAFITPNFTAPA